MTARSGAQDPAGASAERAQDQASPDGAAADWAAADGAAAGGKAAPGPVARLPYEQARDELTDLVKRLEAGGLTLEQSLELWERGERLADICAEWLEGARARLATAMARRNDTSADPAAPF